MPARTTVAVRPVVARCHISSTFAGRFIPCLVLLVLSLGRCSAQANSPAKPDLPAQVGTVSLVAIAPERITLVPGDIKQFSATVSCAGSCSEGITWSVNDLVGGSTALGTISKSGLYVTPYPTPQSVTVKARSTVDQTKSAAAVINFAEPPM